ncbi:MAG: hypothetical protein ACP5O7_12480 [Phycisphaerae bacterium]
MAIDNSGVFQDSEKPRAENALKTKHIHNCDNGLAAVVDAWAALPEALRAGIVAMVQAAAGKVKP